MDDKVLYIVGDAEMQSGEAAKILAKATGRRMEIVPSLPHRLEPLDKGAVESRLLTEMARRQEETEAMKQLIQDYGQQAPRPNRAQRRRAARLAKKGVVEFNR